MGREQRLLPTFLLIGAAKSGTTSLYQYLKQHPDIYMPAKKEPSFFTVDEGEVVEEGGPNGRRIGKSRVNKLADYQALFQDATTEKARGEASPFYLYVPKSPDRIKQCIPDADIFVVLRNPIERAYSAFLNQVRDGVEVHADFAAALKDEPRRIEENWGPIYHYRRMGFYYEQLARYYATFNPKKIHVYLYDDLQRNALALTQDIYRILEVDPTFAPDTLQRHNIAGVPKNRLLHRFYLFLKGSSRSPVKEVGKRVLPMALRSTFKIRVMKNLQEKNLAKPPLLPEVREDLLEGYRKDILKLQDLISCDLSSWL